MGPPPAWHPPPDPSHHGSTQGHVTIRFCASGSSSFSGLSSVDLRRGHSLPVPVRNFWGNALALPTLDEVLAATGFRVGSCAPPPAHTPFRGLPASGLNSWCPSRDPPQWGVILPNQSSSRFRNWCIYIFSRFWDVLGLSVFRCLPLFGFSFRDPEWQ